MTPNQPRPDNPHRAVRVEDALWEAAKAKAAAEGTTVSAVIRRLLTAWVEPPATDLRERIEALADEWEAAGADDMWDQRQYAAAELRTVLGPNHPN